MNLWWRKRESTTATERSMEPSAMRDGPAPDDAEIGRVAGERGIPSVNRVRSLQSRVSTALAIALVGAVGLGFLTWYYTQALTRGERRQRDAERAVQQRAQNEMALPPLGPLERPRVVAVNQSIEDGTASFAELMLGPPPPSPPHAAPKVAAAQRSRQTGARSTNSSVLERRLSGAVLISTSGRAGPTRSDGERTPRPDSTFDDTAAAANSGGLGAMLTPSVMSATRARVLPSQRLLLPKGTFVDCTLETAIDTSLAGLTTCITATDTFSADGAVVLLERGSKLIGETRGQVQPGSARVFVLWTEARTPDGVIAPLGSPGTDELGRSGLPGHANRHFWERFGAALLISVVDGTVQAAAQSQSDGAVIVNPSTTSQIMTEILRQTINIPPTVLKHQGDRIQVLAARDIDFGGVYELRVSE